MVGLLQGTKGIKAPSPISDPIFLASMLEGTSYHPGALASLQLASVNPQSPTQVSAMMGEGMMPLGAVGALRS